jgi:hypothetical protein
MDRRQQRKRWSRCCSALSRRCSVPTTELLRTSRDALRASISVESVAAMTHAPVIRLGLEVIC